MPLPRSAAPVPGAGAGPSTTAVGGPPRDAARRRSAGAALLLLAAVLVGLAGAGPADAATYRTPGYKGVRTAPKTLPAPSPAPITLGAGEKPQVLVDAAGTAHVVWNDRRGDDADALVYCRVKRGAKACDVRHDLVPTAPPSASSPGPPGSRTSPCTRASCTTTCGSRRRTC